MREIDAIHKIAALFPRSPAQKNALFEADAEIFELNGSLLAMTTDEFSPEEDFFSQFFPERLGHNLVAATLSDLLAAGADPRFLVHAFSAPKGAAPEFIEGLCRGMSAALATANCFLLGGDFGTSESWRYVGTALGTVEKPLRRSGAHTGAVLCSTGRFGSGNLGALLLAASQSGKLTLDDTLRTLASPLFPCRIEAARCIRKYASFAMDSSDGYLNSLLQLSRCNPDVELRAAFSLDLVIPEGVTVLSSQKMPGELLLMGSAGEYELVFGVPVEQFEAFNCEMTAAKIPYHRVGEVTIGRGVRLELGSSTVSVNPEAVPDPREMSTTTYITKLHELLHAWRSGS
jgi:thiamine-monophosphate kinase